MARLVPRASSRLWITLLVLVPSGLGLLWGYSQLHREADLLPQAARAYGRHDFSAAADLARRRLKAAPDDVEALRLFARSTARLGRDASANLMFSRLGSETLRRRPVPPGSRPHAVRQAARGPGRLAEGAALEPDHAEALDQVVAVLAAESRLIEAAGLAERLARQPGWELKGELSLAPLRAELGDPAGAAALLHQALLRPEAARLSIESRTQYRKLLARTLLETGQPAQARTLLQELLKTGPDPQASWLLSRVGLQEGAKREAAAALDDAGTYRALHPLEWEPARSIGEDRCAKCHPDIFQAHLAGRHSSTFLRGQGLAAFPFPTGTVPDPDHPAVSHRFRKNAGEVEFETETADRVRTVVLAYAFGSPDHYVSFVGSDEQGQPSIIRLSRYQSGHESGWVRTTGHSANDDRGAGASGKPLEAADGVYKCLFCHTTAPRAVLKDIGPEAGDRGIGCERCHGPGGNHVEAVQALFADPAIVNPAAASGEARMGLCGQCHGYHQESPVPRDDPFWIRFQSTTLAWSRCYSASNGALDCTTCHDPHHDAEHAASFYEQKCLACHSGEGPKDKVGERRKNELPSTSHPPPATRPPLAVCPVSPVSGCLTCHMPPYRSQPLHARFADHYIRVHPPAEASKPGL